jgi:lipopolysaccharide export system protein LptA
MPSFDPRRLRLWISAAAALVLLIVGGFVLRGYLRSLRLRRPPPAPVTAGVQQTAQGFTFSKSEGGRTLFTVHASQMVQFRAGGNAELHDVNIIVYGRKSNRFDQIYGAGFEYDPKEQIIRANGEVQIDLQSDTQGTQHPDQAPPQEMKNPVHLRTSGLVFNQRTGIAETSQPIEFRTPQASGSAVGAIYDSGQNTLVLQRDVKVHTRDISALPGAAASAAKRTAGDRKGAAGSADIFASHAVIHSETNTAVLENVTATRGAETLRANRATLVLRDDSSVEKIVAAGEVTGSDSRNGSRMQAALAEFFLDEHSMMQRGVLSGGTTFQAFGARPAHGTAGRVLINFGPQNTVKTVRAEENVDLIQDNVGPAAHGQTGGARLRNDQQRTEIKSAALDLLMRPNGTPERATTAGAAQIILIGESNASSAAGSRGLHAGVAERQGRSARSPEAQTTTLTAGRFNAEFDAKGRLQSLHGAPDAKTLTVSPGQPDRVTTSRELDVAIVPGGNGIASITQSGDFAYSEADRRATAERAQFNAASNLLTLAGSPRYSDSQASVSATELALNRQTGEMHARGDVKTTYTEQKSDSHPAGAMLGGSDPIHATAPEMFFTRAPGANPGPATGTARFFGGGVRLWQGTNIIQAPAVTLDRERRTLVAQGNSAQRVETVFTETGKNGKATPVTVNATRLIYSDSDRRARFEGGVTMLGADSTLTADRADIFLLPAGTQRSQPRPVAANPAPAPAQVERIVAEGNVRMQQPERVATGQKLLYTAANDSFLLTGGPPAITDAERGRVTGDSLTFYRADDRVVVDSEGKDKSRTVIHLRGNQ